MGLTWRDLVSSAAMVLIFLAYIAFMQGSALPFFSNVWAVCLLELLLGVGCAVAAGDLHTRPQPRPGVVLRKITTFLGTVGLLAGLIGLFSGSERALEILVVATILLWLAGTCWHVNSIGAEP
ncbi:MAG TPA: hypothetical protein VLX31_16580 [Streptosporangiaceae bacterium]|nr:hypothetical protein [Streptosporangiaceae bacterium]